MEISYLYPKSDRYSADLSRVYSECSGPGGLKLAEFMAEKMGLHREARLLDIGIERGFQICFLAKEYGMQAIGLDPDGEARIIQQDGGRRLTYGNVLARKPSGFSQHN